MKPVTTKVVAGIAVVALAGLSFGVSYVHTGHASLAIALGIAAAKAVIVGVVFMEIGRERASFKLALLAAAFLVASLLGFVASDVTQRLPPPLPSTNGVDE